MICVMSVWVGLLLQVKWCEECPVRMTYALLVPWELCVECCHQCARVVGGLEVAWVAVSSSCWWTPVELVLVMCVLVVCV